MGELTWANFIWKNHQIILLMDFLWVSHSQLELCLLHPLFWNAFLRPTWWSTRPVPVRRWEPRVRVATWIDIISFKILFGSRTQRFHSDSFKLSMDIDSRYYLFSSTTMNSTYFNTLASSSSLWQASIVCFFMTKAAASCWPEKLTVHT